MIEEFKNEDEIQMVVFHLGNEEYALPIENVQEIIMKQRTTRIPKMPLWAEGVINLRGHIIPILDGKNRFELLEDSSNKNDPKVIILNINEQIVGLTVDEVNEVIYIKTENIEPTPIELEDKDFLYGIGKYENRLIVLINPQKLLNHTEFNDLKNLIKNHASVKADVTV